MQDQKLGVMVAISRAVLSRDEPCATLVPTTQMQAFLQKFYKRNLSTSHRINEVRLARFNALLYKLCDRINSISTRDLEVLMFSVCCFVNKITTSSPDEEDKLRILSASYHWLGVLLPLAAQHSPEGAKIVLDLLEYLLRAKKMNIPSQEDYQVLLSEADILKRTEVTAEDQATANRQGSDSVVIDDVDETSALFRYCDLVKLFSALLNRHSNDQEVLDLLLVCEKKVQVGSKIQFFWRAVVVSQLNSPTATKEKLPKMIEYVISKGDFDVKGRHRLQQAVVQLTAGLPLTDATVPLDIPAAIVKSTSPQLLRQLIEVQKNIPALIELFENPSVESYAPLYLILKSEVILPKQMLEQIWKLKDLPNRKAILIAFMLTQQKKSLCHEVIKYYGSLKDPSRTQRLRTIHFLHLSLQATIQPHLLARILQLVPVNKLNAECDYSYFTFYPMEKARFDKPERTIVVNLFSQETQPNERLYRVKIDLLSLMGEPNSLPPIIETITKYTTKKPDELVESLLSVTDDTLLELLLMKINKTFESTDMGELSAKLVDWAFKTHSKQLEQYRKATRRYFASIGLESVTNMALAIKAWNTASKDTLGMQQLTPFLNPPEREKVVDDNYVNFLIRMPNTTPLDQCLRAESRVRELETFVGFLDEKHYGKKQFKKIIEANATPQMYLLQILNYYHEARVRCPDLLRATITKLSPDAEVQQLAEKKLEEYQVNLEGIEFFFQFMLGEAYPEGLSFICKLVKSKNPKDDRQTKRKKTKRKDKDEGKDFPTRIFNSFLDCLPLVLGSPERVGSNFQQLIETIDKLIKLKCADETFVDNLIAWVAKFRLLPMANYEGVCQTVANLRSFWISAQKVLAERIQLADIEAQVDYITSLVAQTRQFTDQPRYEELYNNLLTIVHVLYSLQHTQQTEGGNISKMPRTKLKTLSDKFRVRPTNEGLYFYCDTCQKHVCQSCASFMHRNHDKSYVNKDKGTCNHEGDQRKKERSRPEDDMDELQRMELLAMDPEKLAHYKRYEKERDRRERERERDRQFQAMRLKEELLLNYQAQAAARQGGSSIAYVPGMPGTYSYGFSGFTYSTGLGQGLLTSAPSSLNPNPPQILTIASGVVAVPTLNESDENLEIKSTTEKSIIESVSRCAGEFSDPQFVQQPPEGSEGPCNKVSMAGLLVELMHSVQKQSLKRYGQKELDGESNNTLEKFTFDTAGLQVVMELQNEKYIMFKINGSRGGDDQEYDKRGRSVPNRALACSNGRIMAVKVPTDGNDVLMFYHQGKLRRSLKKRERSKKLGDAEAEGNFQIDKRQPINFEIVSMSFSKKNPSLLLICGDTNFQLYTITEGKDYRKTSYPNSIVGGDRIIKALWMPESGTRIIVATSKQIRIYEIMDASSNPNLRIISRYPSVKPIADFHISKNEQSSLLRLYVCDHEGNVFVEKISSEEDRGNPLSSKMSVPGFDGNAGITSFMVNEQSGLCLMSFREGSNLLCRMRDNVITKLIDLRLQALISPRSESYAIMDRSGYVIVDARLIFSSKEAAIITCLIRRGGQNTGGNVAIIEISGTNSVHIQCLNGNNRTDSYEVVPYEDEGQSERFMILGIQNDGTMWLRPYEVRISLTQSPKQEDLTEDKLEQYNKQILEKHLLSEVVGGSRKIDFREASGKLNSVNMNETPGEKLVLTLNANVFVTGLVIRVDAPGLLNFTLFDREYEFNVRQPREVQIPLNLKQTLQVFVSHSLTIFINKKLAVEVYVVPWDKPSVYYDAYRQLVKMHSDHYSFDRKDAKNYFNNAERSDLMNISQQALQKLFKDSKLEPSDANFIMEMELLVQALDRNGMSLSIHQIEQFLGSVKRFLLIDKPLVKTTVRRLFRKVFWLYRIVAAREGRSVSIGDPYDYFTFKDLFWVEKLYRDFLNKTNLWRLDQLLEKLHRLKCKRLANLYLVFGLFPKLLTRVCEYYRRELENCLEGYRQRMNDRITLIVKLLVEHYQYNKNRGNVDSEIETFFLLELLLSGMSKNKEIYKDIILRAFYCFETLPMLKTSVQFSYGCRLFEVAPCSMDKNVLGGAHAGLSQMQQEDPPDEEYKRSEEEEQSDMRPYEDIQWNLLRQPQAPSMMLEENSQSDFFALDTIRRAGQSPVNKNLQECDLAKHLSEQRSNTEVNITYFDFIYELTVSLFRIESRIKKENCSLYIGLLFNLMSLLDVRINQYKKETAHRMITELAEVVHKRLTTGETPSLYIVLAHFLEPNYDELRKNGKVVDAVSQNRKLKKYLLRYYKETGIYAHHLKSLFVQKLPPPNTKCFTLKEAFFNELDITSHIYQIKYIGNLYLNLLLEGIRVSDLRIKEYILKGYVKDRLRVFKNILILEGWKEELDRMKFEVAFEQLKQNDFEMGFSRLQSASKKQPTALVNYLNSDITRLEFLESLLSNSAACRFCGMLMQVLSLYYQSI